LVLTLLRIAGADNLHGLFLPHRKLQVNTTILGNLFININCM
jgi:hypothetical protein